MKKLYLQLKLISAFTALCFVFSGVNAYGSGVTAEIANISADSNNLISWNTQIGEYSGANIYKLDNNNSLVLVGKSDAYSYKCTANGNYVVKAFSDYGESMGKIITVQDGKLFKVSLEKYGFSKGYVNCTVKVENISDKTACGVTAVRVLSNIGEVNNSFYKKLTLKAGASDTFSVSLSEKQYGKTLSVSVWESSLLKKLYSNEIVQDYKSVSEDGEQIIARLKDEAEVLKNLIDECEEKGISTDYEKINYNIINRFAGYVEEDILNEDTDRLDYTNIKTAELYNQAKTNLEAYLAGEKTPKSVPKYITSDNRIEGQSMYATFDNNGMQEERPAFYVGYIGYDQVKNDISELNGFGANSVQQELGPSHIFTTGNKWKKVHSNGPSVTYTISNESPDGNGKSLLIKYNSEVSPNKFFTFYQTVKVRPGRTYTLRGKIKTVNAVSAHISANNYNDRLTFSGTSDWKSFTKQYTAPSGVTSTVIRIIVDGPADGVYFTGLSFAEAGTTNELLSDGSFTNYGSTNLTFNENSKDLQATLKMLDEAEKNNVAVSFLLSPHYFFDDIAMVNGFSYSQPGCFFNYNINHPMAREIVENFLRTLIPLIKDYKCINNFCISNEPNFDTSLLPEFYSGEWHEWLSEKYNGDISQLNSAYNSEYTSFDQVELKYDVFDRSILGQTYDYMQFNNKVLGEWHKFMADIVHELAPDIPVNAKILGWVNSSEYRQGYMRGTGLEEYYKFLDINGCDYNHFLDNVNQGMLTKEMWYDYMLSFKNAPVVDTEDHLIRDNSSNFYPDELADYVGNAIYMGAIHGRAMSDIWVWERSMHNTALRDSILYRPDAIAKVGYAANDLNRLSYEITALQNEPAEVGIIFSNNDQIFNSWQSAHALYEAYEALNFNGKKTRFILDIDPTAMQNYKAVIVPCTRYISDAMLDELNKFVNNGGKVLIMGRGDSIADTGCLSMNEYGAVRDASSYRNIYDNAYFAKYSGVIQMESMTKQEFCSIVRNMLTDAGIYNVKLVNADTNEPAHNVEYNIGTYDNKLIINLSNFGNTQNIKIYSGDTLLNNSLNLISGETEGGIITLDKFEVKTLKTDIER